MTALGPCTIRVEDAWGPQVAPTCLYGFDFTLLFEETILSILPLGIAAIWSLLRIVRLGDANAKLLPLSPLHIAKLVSLPSRLPSSCCTTYIDSSACLSRLHHSTSRSARPLGFAQGPDHQGNGRYLGRHMHRLRRLRLPLASRASVLCPPLHPAQCLPRNPATPRHCPCAYPVVSRRQSHRRRTLPGGFYCQVDRLAPRSHPEAPPSQTEVLEHFSRGRQWHLQSRPILVDQSFISSWLSHNPFGEDAI